MAAKKSPFGTPFEPRAPLSVLVSRQLRGAIVAGELALGTELPSEKELTERMGVSRATIREALRILQAQGLLTGGDTVSTSRPRVTGEHVLDSAVVAMEHVLRLGNVPLGDLVELRVLIEGAALEQAAARHSGAPLGDAARALDAMRAAVGNVESFRAADLSFHRAMVTASDNAAYPMVMGVLRGAISAHLGEALNRVEDAPAAMRRLTEEHAAIFAAVERGHGKRARTLVSAHIRDFYGRVSDEAVQETPGAA